MTKEREFTSGEAAELAEVPHSTLKSWYQRGFLDFIRYLSDEDEVVARRWVRFEFHEVLEIAVMHRLTQQTGMTPALASVAVERLRAVIMGAARRRYLAIVQVGTLYAFNTATRFEELKFEANWFSKQGDGMMWHCPWFHADGREATRTPVPEMPAVMTLIEMTRLREAVERRKKELIAAEQRTET